MNIDQIRRDIKKRRSQPVPETYAQIGESFNIAGSLARYIELHPDYKPNKETAERMKLDPSPRLIATRDRQATLDNVAKEWGYKSWSQFCTVVYRERKDRGPLPVPELF